MSSDLDIGKTSSNSYRHPVFDGSDDSKFRVWWDEVMAYLQMEDIEEYVEEIFRDVPMPAKDETVPAVGVTDPQVIADAAKKKIIRKEMKKAKAHMALVSDEFHNVLS
jgi:CBS domain containing-hemolysin-like protein